MMLKRTVNANLKQTGAHRFRQAAIDLTFINQINQQASVLKFSLYQNHQMRRILLQGKDNRRDILTADIDIGDTNTDIFIRQIIVRFF